MYRWSQCIAVPTLLLCACTLDADDRDGTLANAKAPGSAALCGADVTGDGQIDLQDFAPFGTLYAAQLGCHTARQVGDLAAQQNCPDLDHSGGPLTTADLALFAGVYGTAIDSDACGQDGDGDGLTGFDEAWLGTSDALADTDGDGATDPEELDADTDALDASSTPGGDTGPSDTGSSDTGAPNTGTLEGTIADGGQVLLRGSGFGSNTHVGEAAFLGGIDGWTANKEDGTYLKSVTPFSNAEGSEWNYVYSGYGQDDMVSSEVQRVAGKNNLRLRTGGLTPSGTFDSTFGLDTEQPNQDFFISFWARLQIESMEYGTGECTTETCVPQIKFFSVAPHADEGEPGVVMPGFYGSNRNQWVVGTKVYPDDGGGYYTRGWGGEWYTHHTKPTLPETWNVCGADRAIYATGIPFVDPATQIDGVGGYNGQNCEPYWWGFHENGGVDEQHYAPPLDDWFKIQIWIKGGEFDAYDGRLIWQQLHSDGMHENTLDLENVNLFTLLYGDNGEFTYPRRFFFYGYFAQTCIWSDTCSTSSTGDLKIFVDDFFVQPGTVAHLELGDAAVYSETGQLEIQKPISWSDTEIGFELNYGTFEAGETVFLFVVDDDGTASEGMPITLQ